MTAPLHRTVVRLGFAIALTAMLAACTGSRTGHGPDDGAPDDDAEPSDAQGDRLDLDALACSEEDALRLFEHRIAPLVDPARVDSCNKCHLAGVELRRFVRDTPCHTMACMERLGVVDLQDPEQSLVLGWIRRSEPDSTLITDAVVQAEHDAFLEWIRYSARCGAQTCEAHARGDDDPCGGQTELVEPAAAASTLLAGCDQDSLTAAFEQKVMPWVSRCAHCHSTSYPLPEPLVGVLPQWAAPEGHPDAARRTMLNLLAAGAIDLDHPEQSLLLTKPLAIATGGVEHGGGDKIESPDEPTYRDFESWIQLYASCANASQEPDEPTP